MCKLWRELLTIRYALVVPVHGGDGSACESVRAFMFEQEKGIWWMPWHQEAMKDVARCENPGGAASKL